MSCFINVLSAFNLCESKFTSMRHVVGLDERMDESATAATLYKLFTYLIKICCLRFALGSFISCFRIVFPLYLFYFKI